MYSDRNPARRFVMWAVITGSLASAPPALALRCPGGFVAEGVSQYEVLQRCGEPTLADSRQEEHRFQNSNGLVLTEQRTVEEWLYDFGSSNLASILVFHDGRLVRIESRGHGGYPGSLETDRSIVSIGDPLTEVVLKWGQPTYHDRRTEVISVPIFKSQPARRETLRDLATLPLGTTVASDRANQGRLSRRHSAPKLEAVSQRTVQVDELIYDLGPDRLIRTLVFHDGRLVEKRSGSRGWTK